jgi:hypothetical protein
MAAGKERFTYAMEEKSRQNESIPARGFGSAFLVKIF